MTALIEFPGTLTSTTGMDPVTTVFEVIPGSKLGFPDNSLASLYLFADGSGTTPANSVSGASAGLIESLISSNNAYSWLTGGGGLQIQGGQIVSMPAIDLRNPWTIVLGSLIVGSVGDTTSAKNYMEIAFRTTLVGNFRGAMAYIAGDVQWNPPTAPMNHVIRVSNGAGTAASPTNLTPTNSTGLIGVGRVRLLSYNGVDTITQSIYDKNGNLLFTGTVATTDTNLVTGASSVVQNTVQPMIGPYPSATYCQGKMNVEAAAVYTRLLTPADITAICTASAALASARGRAW
jgi:hypothetical protein